MNVVTRFVAVEVPVLHTRAPARNSCGRVVVAGLLLSKPTMFHVMGGGGLVPSGGGTETEAGGIRLIVSTACASALRAPNTLPAARIRTQHQNDLMDGSQRDRRDCPGTIFTHCAHNTSMAVTRSRLRAGAARLP
jgi:hypothetical protein